MQFRPTSTLHTAFMQWHFRKPQSCNGNTGAWAVALKVMHMPLCRVASGSAPRSSQEVLLEGASDGVQEAGTTLAFPTWMLSSCPASNLHP